MKIEKTIIIADDEKWKKSTATIIITDEEEIVNTCKQQEIPVIVWLNEHNQGISLPNGIYCVENLADITEDFAIKVYQRTKGLPWTILETERLFLREITPEDVPRLYELYADPAITKYMENLYADPDVELAYTKDYIQHVYHFYGYGMWIIVEKESGAIIGRAGVESKDEVEGLELGFMLGTNYQHKGYAYEICSAIIHYAKEELEENIIYAHVHEGNEPSRRLCEKLGLYQVASDKFVLKSN